MMKSGQKQDSDVVACCTVADVTAYQGPGYGAIIYLALHANGAAILMHKCRLPDMQPSSVQYMFLAPQHACVLFVDSAHDCGVRCPRNSATEVVCITLIGNY